MSNPTASWLYAVTGHSVDRLPVLHGVAGEVVWPLRCGSLSAIVGTVGLAEFGAEPLQRACSDPVWLERTARSHHRIVADIASRAPAVPFRFATLYLGDDRVRAFVGQRRGALQDLLRQVAGRAEWGVKAYWQQSEAAASSPAPAARSGTAYLMQRRRQLTSRADAWSESVAHAEKIHQALARLAVAAVRHPISEEAARSEFGYVVLNASYLVDDARQEQFAGTARALARAGGSRAELTGPWAAYSFTSLAPLPGVGAGSEH